MLLHLPIHKPILVCSHLYITAGSSSAIPHTCRVFHLLHHANIWRLPYCIVLYSRCNFCFGTRVNKMGAMAWNSSYSQAYTRFDTCFNVQLFLGHRLFLWFLFLGSTLSDETEPVHSPLFTSIIVKWFIIFSLFLSHQATSLRFPHWQMCRRMWWSIYTCWVAPRWSTRSTTRCGRRPTLTTLWVAYDISHIALDSSSHSTRLTHTSQLGCAGCMGPE